MCKLALNKETQLKAIGEENSNEIDEIFMRFCCGKCEFLALKKFKAFYKDGCVIVTIIIT